MCAANWQYRHAALMAISACGEGCHQQMEAILANIVDAILPFLQDPVSFARLVVIYAIHLLFISLVVILETKLNRIKLHLSNGMLSY